MHTRHPDEETLLAYADGQLDSVEAGGIEAHLQTCSACGGLVAEARGLAVAASSIVSALDDVPAGVIPARPRRSLPPWLAAAAVVVLAVGVSSVAIRSTPDSELATQSVSAVESRQDAADAPIAAPDAAPAAGRATATAAPEAGAVSVAPAEVVGQGAVASGRPANAKALAQRGQTAARGVAAPSDLQVTAAPPAGALPASPPPPAPSGESRAFAAEPSQMRPAEERAGTDSRRATITPAGAGKAQRVVTVTGRVTAVGGRAVAGAAVSVRELGAATQTDSVGHFMLELPNLDTAVTLRVRATGYVPVEESLVTENSRTVNIMLRADRVQLGEAIVTGAPTREQGALSAGADASAPLRVVRYRAPSGAIVELREFAPGSPRLQTPPSTNEFRWRNAATGSVYVLTGAFTRVELESLAHRLSELQIVR